METSYKCQTSLDSFVDSMFIVFVQSYLVNAVQKFCSENNKTSKDRARVLDIGCFNGRLFQFMVQQRTFVEYTGVDVRRDYIDSSPYGRRKDVTLLCEDVTEGLSVPRESIDIAVSSEVLEHIHDSHWPNVLKNIRNTLVPGGLFVVGFPMNTEEKTYHYPEKEKSLGHVNFPCHDSFKSLVESAGFEVVDFDSCYSLKSSYRIPKEVRESAGYKKIRSMCGSQVARAWAMTFESDHTGGGFYTLKKI